MAIVRDISGETMGLLVQVVVFQFGSVEVGVTPLSLGFMLDISGFTTL